MLERLFITSSSLGWKLHVGKAVLLPRRQSSCKRNIWLYRRITSQEHEGVHLLLLRLAAEEGKKKKEESWLFTRKGMTNEDSHFNVQMSPLWEMSRTKEINKLAFVEHCCVSGSYLNTACEPASFYFHSDTVFTHIIPMENWESKGSEMFKTISWLQTLEDRVG